MHQKSGTLPRTRHWEERKHNRGGEKRHIGKRASHFPMCSFVQVDKGGRERTETEGDQWGCFNRAMCCFIFLSCARCSVQSRWLRPSSFRFAVVDRVNFQVRPNRFVVVFRVQPLRVNCWSGRRLRKPRCLPVPQ